MHIRIHMHSTITINVKRLLQGRLRVRNQPSGRGRSTIPPFHSMVPFHRIDTLPFASHHQSDIEMGLKLQAISALTFAKFLTRISKVMFLYNRYPKKADFECVVEQIVTRYPFMVSPLECAVSTESFMMIIMLAIIHLISGRHNQTLQRRLRECRREYPGTKKGG